MKRSFFILIVFAACGFGCASSGHKMEADKLAQVHPGQTTKVQMLGWFGTPSFQALDTTGKTTMNWQYVEAQSYAFHTVVKTQSLSVLFDASDIVEKISLVDDVNRPDQTEKPPPAVPGRK